MNERGVLRDYGGLVQREFGFNPWLLNIVRHLRWLMNLLFVKTEPYVKYERFLKEVDKDRTPSNVVAEMKESGTGTSGGW